MVEDDKRPSAAFALRDGVSSTRLATGAAVAFVLCASALSFSDGPAQPDATWRLRGTIAPDATPAPDPRLPAAAKRV